MEIYTVQRLHAPLENKQRETRGTSVCLGRLLRGELFSVVRRRELGLGWCGGGREMQIVPDPEVPVAQVRGPYSHKWSYKPVLG